MPDRNDGEQPEPQLTLQPDVRLPVRFFGIRDRNDRPSGRGTPFSQGVAVWSRMLALAAPENRMKVFGNIADEGAVFIDKGADRARIGEELFDCAERHG